MRIRKELVKRESVIMASQQGAMLTLLAIQGKPEGTEADASPQIHHTYHTYPAVINKLH